VGERRVKTVISGQAEKAQAQADETQATVSVLDHVTHLVEPAGVPVRERRQCQRPQKGTRTWPP
jgi:hypothetical protein